MRHILTPLICIALCVTVLWMHETFLGNHNIGHFPERATAENQNEEKPSGYRVANDNSEILCQTHTA